MEEGHFYVVLGEDVDVSTGRFKILSLLGEGTFGKVVEAWDRKRKEYCAVKIVRNVPKYTRDAEIEIRYMERIRNMDPQDKAPLMKIQRHFKNDNGHVCIVMHKYGPCLLDWLQKHGTFSHRHLAEMIFNVGVSLDVFHTEMKMMHTDLKPENILLESSAIQKDSNTQSSASSQSASSRAQPQLPCSIRVCDLGGACDERHSRHAIVSTRHYRSPEVILGLGWMYSTDMWSIGCIIYELFTGKLLYDTHDNLEHLHLMEKTIAPLPNDWHRMVSQGTMEDAKPLFSSKSTVASGLRSLSEPKHLARVARARPIGDNIRDDDLKNLILSCLNYDRTKRLSARQMTQHPYVLKYFPESRQQPMHPSNRGNIAPTPMM